MHLNKFADLFVLPNVGELILSLLSLVNTLYINTQFIIYKAVKYMYWDILVICMFGYFLCFFLPSVDFFFFKLTFFKNILQENHQVMSLMSCRA